MPRSVWSGAITFSMLSIPVKLYGATESKDLKFTTLHTECRSRLKEKRWCPADDREVFAEEIQRVYEYSKNDYVDISPEDADAMPLASKGVIELTSFVNTSEVDPVYFEKSYYIEPEAAGAKPYALLLRSLRSKGVAAIAKITMRNKESLCQLRAGVGNVIVLDTLYYPDEVRTMQMPDVLVSAGELAMGSSLVDMLQAPFDPSAYQDEYRVAMLALIEAKHSGQPIDMTDMTRPIAAPTDDLMAALEASIAAAAANRPAGRATAQLEEPTEPAVAAAPRVRRARS